MNIDSAREFCLSLPHATENIQWDADLCLKIAGKLFAVIATEPGGRVLSFKCTPENFYALQETEGIIPAPYMARAQWVSLERWDVLRDDELRELLRTSYDLVFAKLTRQQQEDLQAGKKVVATRPRPKSVKKTAASKAPGRKAAKRGTSKRGSR